MEEVIKNWTKDQERTLMEIFRKNKSAVCPDDRNPLQMKFLKHPKGKPGQQVEYTCTECHTHFEFLATNEDMKWRRMNGGKR